jgi:transcriptional regulator with XRE-family HTH domain|tara:strand:+ start:333 stop:521 length:189 start_codon:yes stop_codon:yes gene_type:complete
MIITYLEQLKKIAKDTGWLLEDACDDLGIARTTIYRWHKQISHPNERIVIKLARYMQTYRRS